MPAAKQFATWVERAVIRAGGWQRVCDALGMTRQGLWAARKRGTLPTRTEDDRARVRLLAKLSGIGEAKLVGLVPPPTPPRVRGRRPVAPIATRPRAASAAAKARATVAVR